ncbi:MAG: helix-turn-helix domain-containing protein [Cytophagales bacterium]|nr:helix-turn-helix domain-containing protein [Cytophagales bacterium]
MPKRIFELKHIFGLKVKELRQERGLTYQQLNTLSGLSVSYLSEIESGKKYPKGDKIAVLADALGVQYDELVSLQVPRKLQPVVDMMDSHFFKEFPLEEFGLSPAKLVEIVSEDPDKINALINTISQVVRSYELRKQPFYEIALRSYQELRLNFFEELEQVVEEMHLEFFELKDLPFQPELLEDILLKIGVRASYDTLAKYESLKDLRSLYDEKKRLLYLNQGLTRAQRNFLLGREIAFQWMRVQDRPAATPPQKAQNFDMLLNSHRASYFSAALIMPKDRMVKSVEKLFEKKTWDSKGFLNLLTEFDATPEMVMQRLTNLLPTFFELRNLFFMRFLKSPQEESVVLTKELHLSHLNDPEANERNQRYFKTWVTESVFEKLKGGELVIEPHISEFEDASYFCWALAFTNVSNPLEQISVMLGVRIDEEVTQSIKFLSDPKIPRNSAQAFMDKMANLDSNLLERKIQADIDQILLS